MNPHHWHFPFPSSFSIACAAMNKAELFQVRSPRFSIACAAMNECAFLICLPARFSIACAAMNVI